MSDTVPAWVLQEIGRLHLQEIALQHEADRQRAIAEQEAARRVLDEQREADQEDG